MIYLSTESQHPDSAYFLADTTNIPRTVTHLNRFSYSTEIPVFLLKFLHIFPVSSRLQVLAVPEQEYY